MKYIVFGSWFFLLYGYDRHDLCPSSAFLG